MQLIERLLAPLPIPQTVPIHPVRHLGEHAAQQGHSLTFDISLPDLHESGRTCVLVADGRAATCTCVAVTAKIGEQVVGRSEAFSCLFDHDSATHSHVHDQP